MEEKKAEQRPEVKVCKSPHEGKKLMKKLQNKEQRQQIMNRVEMTKKAREERWPIFQVGQVVHLEGHDYKVVKINPAKGVVSIQSVKYKE